MSEPTTIIVPTINARPDLLQTCQDECLRTMRDGDRFLVVEGGTFAENCNAGSILVETPTIIFLNDDCKPDQDDWIDRLLDPFADENVGIVGCRLIYPTGQIQHAGVSFFQDAEGLLHGQHFQYDTPTGPMSAVTAACMAIRTDLFHFLNGFDADYRNGNEDVDLCLRARNLGHDVWYTAEATVIHHESKSGDARWTHVRDNIRIFNERWRVDNGTVVPADRLARPAL
jgi:GT2 family glycosyltransferase